MPYDKANDRFHGQGSTSNDFGRAGAPITPSNSADITPYPKAIVCAAAGDLVCIPVENPDDVVLTFTECPVGFVPPFQIRRVKATGTTGTWVAVLA